MPRARLIKPEFWDDQKLGMVSRGARLTFTGLWTYSDDYGIVQGSPVWLKNKIFPYDDDLALADFSAELQELQEKGLIIPFSKNGEDYFHIKNFLKHQTISKPSKTRNPQPPDTKEDSGNAPEHSGNAHDYSGGITEYSGNAPDEAEVEVEVEVKAINPGMGLSKELSLGKYAEQEARLTTQCQLIKSKRPGKISKKTWKGAVFWLNKNLFVKRAHPAALVEVLDEVIKHWDTIQFVPEKYAEAILERTNGNYHEADKVAEEQKEKEANETWARSVQAGALLDQVGLTLH